MILTRWALLASLTLMPLSLELAASTHNQFFTGEMLSDANMSLLIPARQNPASHPVWLNSERFDSQESAVEAASDRFNPYSIAEDREYVGLILLTNNLKSLFTSIR